MADVSEADTAYSAGIGNVVDVLREFFEVESGTADDSMDIDLRPLAGGYLGRVRFASQELHRSVWNIARSKFDQVLVISPLEGSFTLQNGAGLVEAHAGDVCVIDLREPSTLLADHVDAHVWIMSRESLEQFGLDDRTFRSFLIEAHSPTARLLAETIRMADQMCRSYKLEEARQIILPITALVANCLAAFIAAIHPDEAAREASLTLAIRKYIDECIGEPTLCADVLARRFGMARATLYRQFAPFGGVATYIRERRLQMARQEIYRCGGKPLRLGVLAARLGFASTAAFTRAFRKEFGQSPKEFAHALAAKARAESIPA